MYFCSEALLLGRAGVKTMTTNKCEEAGTLASRPSIVIIVWVIPVAEIAVRGVATCDFC
ncbi:hypothetical protein J14TS5_00970 [Paenibacillus lautus]|nr:hypothetical protein J14TS5_00970 [Paenibacillus lautus]